MRELLHFSSHYLAVLGFAVKTRQTWTSWWKFRKGRVQLHFRISVLMNHDLSVWQRDLLLLSFSDHMLRTPQERRFYNLKHLSCISPCPSVCLSICPSVSWTLERKTLLFSSKWPVLIFYYEKWNDTKHKFCSIKLYALGSGSLFCFTYVSVLQRWMVRSFELRGTRSNKKYSIKMPGVSKCETERWCLSDFLHLLIPPITHSSHIRRIAEHEKRFRDSGVLYFTLFSPTCNGCWLFVHVLTRDSFDDSFIFTFFFLMQSIYFRRFIF